MQYAPRDPKRSPVPVWLWPIVVLGPFCLFAILGRHDAPTDPRHQHENLVGIISFGTILGVGLTGGLALSFRFYRGWAARTIGMIVFSFLMMIFAAVIVFAGCALTNNIYID